jgi:hypothetical protein
MVEMSRARCRRGSGRNAAWRNASLPQGAMPSNSGHQWQLFFGVSRGRMFLGVKDNEVTWQKSRTGDMERRKGKRGADGSEWTARVLTLTGRG